MHPGLRNTDKKKIYMQKFIFEKCLFEYKIQFAVEKKIGAISFFVEKLLLSPSKKNC